MNEQLGMIGTFLASRRQQATKMPGALDLVETRVEERFEPVRVSESAPSSAPSPPSWDPLGVAPHLWDQLPDLPDTDAVESTTSSSGAGVSRVDGGLRAMDALLSFWSVAPVLAATCVSWLAPPPFDLWGPVLSAFFLSCLLLVFVGGYLRVRPSKPGRPDSLCDRCFSRNVCLSPSDITLCGPCRSLFKLPGWSWEFETASVRSWRIAEQARASVLADRRSGRCAYAIPAKVEL